jgi:hypothetical protein
MARGFTVPTKLVRLIRMCLNETYSKVCICKHSSDAFLVKNAFKQRGAFQIFLRIHHSEGPSKQKCTGNEQSTVASGP